MRKETMMEILGIFLTSFFIGTIATYYIILGVDDFRRESWWQVEKWMRGN